MKNVQALAKSLGRNHALALALWDPGWYEARLLTSFVDEPERVTPAQMNQWCRAFDNWGVCDTLCFQLFDHTPHTWDKVFEWSDARKEFVKRAAFALLASLAGHDKEARDERFLETLPRASSSHAGSSTPSNPEATASTMATRGRTSSRRGSFVTMF